MQRFYAASARMPVQVLSADFEAVRLFCLLGLTLSLAVIPHLDPNTLGWVLAHAE